MLAHRLFSFGLHWAYLSGKWQKNWYWFYFLLQGLCTFTISLSWADMTITAGLYLVLVIEVLSFSKQIWQIVAIIASYLIALMGTMVWQHMNGVIWMSFESVLLLIIFIIGWVILSIQQMHARVVRWKWLICNWLHMLCASKN